MLPSLSQMLPSAKTRKPLQILDFSRLVTQLPMLPAFMSLYRENFIFSLFLWNPDVKKSSEKISAKKWVTG